MFVLLAATFAGGCYRRVVGAQGFAADTMTIEKGNMSGDRDPQTLGYPYTKLKNMPGGN